MFGGIAKTIQVHVRRTCTFFQEVNMKDNKSLLRLTFMGMMIALGVIISPILRVEGMCPMAHLINITCAASFG